MINKNKIGLVALTFMSLMLLPAGAVLAQESDRSGAFILDLNYDHGDFNTNALLLRSSGDWPEPFLGYSTYKYEIWSFDQEILYSSNLEVPNEIITEGPLGTIAIQNLDFVLFTPYLPNAKEIRILGEGNKTLLSVNVARFTKEMAELRLSGKLKLDEAVNVDRFAKEMPEKETFQYKGLVVAIASITAAALAVYFFAVKRRKQNQFGSLKEKWT